jgi:hypothetical protein
MSQLKHAKKPGNFNAFALHTSAVAQSIDGEIEDMIGVAVRQMDFEDVQAPIDGIDQADVLGEFVQQGNAAESTAIDAVVEFEAKVAATAKDGPGAIRQFGLVEAAPQQSLACVEFVAESAMALAVGGLAGATALPLVLRCLLL